MVDKVSNFKRLRRLEILNWLAKEGQQIKKKEEAMDKQLSQQNEQDKRREEPYVNPPSYNNLTSEREVGTCPSWEMLELPEHGTGIESPNTSGIYPVLAQLNSERG